MSEFIWASAPETGSTWARRNSPPVGSKSFSRGEKVASSPTFTVTWSVAVMGGAAPFGNTSSTTRPVADSRRSETVISSSLVPSVLPTSSKVSTPSGRTRTTSPSSETAPISCRSSPSGSCQSVRMFCETSVPAWTRSVVTRCCSGLVFSSSGTTRTVAWAWSVPPRPSSAV